MLRDMLSDGLYRLVKESSRDVRGVVWIEQLAQDLRYAGRRLMKRPGFSGAVIGVLALGIGATTAMFSAVDAAMLRPLPFGHPETLVTLRSVNLPFDMGGPYPAPIGPHLLDINDIAAMRGVFSHVAAYAAGGLNLNDPEHPARVKAGVVTADFFATIGVLPTRGRGFSKEEGTPNGPAAAVISWALWQRQFGAHDVAGLNLQLNGTSYSVVGVMPQGFNFPSGSDVWIPLTIPATMATFEPFRGFLLTTVIARVGPGLSARDAAAQLQSRWEQTVAGGIPPEQHAMVGDLIKQIRVEGAATPLQRDLLGDRRTALLVLFGATGLLLLIACANVMNLLLAHAAVRRREVAVREALGATRGRILRQLLTESLLLAIVGAALGVALAPAALRAMGVLMPQQLAGIAPAEVDLRVLAFAMTLAVLTGTGFGLWPALAASRAGANEAIKSGGGPGATGGGAGRARRALVAAEVGLTVVLLVGAGLMLRSFARVMGLDTGMHTQHVATLELAFPASTARVERLRAVNAILARLTGEPGISSAGIVNDLPLRGGGGISLRISDPVPQTQKEGESGARRLVASTGYFQALGIPLLHGRFFSAADDSLAPPVAIVSDKMARTFWPGVDAVGRTFALSTNPNEPRVTVVGVVADVRELGLEHDPLAQMYYPATADVPANIALVARGALEPGALLARLTEAVHAVDPSQAVFDVRMMDDVVGASVAPRRTNTVLIASFALLALLLSSLGVYAVVAYTVSQRSREFGIRTALGASGRDLIGLVSGEMLWTSVVGLAAGLAGAWALSRVLAGLLFGVTAHDPATFVIVPLALAIAAAIAALIPARRALRVNPADVMRTD